MKGINLIKSISKTLLISLSKEDIVNVAVDTFDDWGKKDAKLRAVRDVLNVDLSADKKLKVIEEILKIEL